jgi:thymidine kinase
MIIGPMFSGKSSELLHRIRMDRMMGKQTMIISHSLDKRYSEEHVVTHNKDKERCISVSSLSPLLSSPEFLQADSVFIEEGQFFDDISEFVHIAVDFYSKSLTIAALDGNSKREPFRNITDLIAFADDVKRYTALCMLCKNSTRAPFSFCHKQSNMNTESNILVGAENFYQSVCRVHYLQLEKL